MCDCRKVLEAKLLEKFKEQYPDGEQHSVSLEGYAFVFGGNTISSKPVMPIRQTYLHTYKNGNKKEKKIPCSLSLSYCPHCGEKVDGKAAEVVMLTTKDGDWEGLFINGKLISEGHQLGEGSKETFWLDIGSKYRISAKDLLVHELCDSDDDFVADGGNFPEYLSDLAGEYVGHID